MLRAASARCCWCDSAAKVRVAVARTANMAAQKVRRLIMMAP